MSCNFPHRAVGTTVLESLEFGGVGHILVMTTALALAHEGARTSPTLSCASLRRGTTDSVESDGPMALHLLAGITRSGQMGPEDGPGLPRGDFDALMFLRCLHPFPSQDDRTSVL